ncbi:transferase [Priestia megaterium]|uniref:acyltransferase n=1 Tax=Priestia megaterium TaxID=1404 RepID=UPI000BF8286B|nr:acyltransferase [Priestia megaterium]PFO15343.1 transferase [Priestia megaterium]
MNSNWFKLLMKSMKIKYGKSLLLKGIPVIFSKSGGNIIIGDNVTIKSSFLSNLVGLYQRTIIVARTPEAKIHIGNNVGISGATIYARKSITIGDNTLIGGNAKILDNDFHPIEVEDRNADIKENIRTKSIIIGENCFIGCNAIILKGTVMGNGCVVGAGAVVSGKFEENCVIAGNPAKIIKRL